MIRVFLTLQQGCESSAFLLITCIKLCVIFYLRHALLHMLTKYRLQMPMISFNCSSVGWYPILLEWVLRDLATCCIRLLFCKIYKLSCSRSQSSALITIKSSPALRVTFSGSWLLTTCSTRDLILSLNLFTLTASISITLSTVLPY